MDARPPPSPSLVFVEVLKELGYQSILPVCVSSCLSYLSLNVQYVHNIIQFAFIFVIILVSLDLHQRLHLNGAVRLRQELLAQWPHFRRRESYRLVFNIFHYCWSLYTAELCEGIGNYYPITLTEYHGAPTVNRPWMNSIFNSASAYMTIINTLTYCNIAVSIAGLIFSGIMGL